MKITLIRNIFLMSLLISNLGSLKVKITRQSIWIDVFICAFKKDCELLLTGGGEWSFQDFYKTAKYMF